MSVRGSIVAAGVEWTKLVAQWKVRLTLVSSVVGPFAFALAIRSQSALPSDTLFGRSVADSGFAVPLVVLGFAAWWVLPALASLVAGDVFSSEDRFGTWSMVLGRSCARREIFAGKALAAMSFVVLAVACLGASSLVAGAVLIGAQPLVGLSGTAISATDVALRVALAWVSTIAPALAIATMAMSISIATRSSVAGIALPVVLTLAMQVVSLVDAPDAPRWLLIATSLGSWHGLFAQPQFHRPLAYGAMASVAYFSLSLGLAWRMLARRDIGR